MSAYNYHRITSDFDYEERAEVTMNILYSMISKNIYVRLFEIPITPEAVNQAESNSKQISCLCI